MNSHLDMMSDELQWPSQFPGEAQLGKLIFFITVHNCAFSIIDGK